MKLISLNIDGNDVQVPSGTTVLDAAQSIDIAIPTLCHFPEVKPSGFCRVCVVEIEGHSELLPACLLQAKDGMIVRTQTKKVIESRRMSVELLVAQHPMQCLTCYRNGKCTLQELASQYGIQLSRFFQRSSDTAEKPSAMPIDEKSPAIWHDPNMCILCGLCIEACRSIQSVDVIDFARRGSERTVGPAFGQSLSDVECIACGQCIQLCPVNSFYEKNDISGVRQALRDPSLHVVGILSPIVGISISEEFDLEAGSLSCEQLVAVLKTLGFDRIFNLGVGVDVLLLEESYELLRRVKAEKQLPMLSSSSPAWVKYIEHFYPNILPLLSSCKSPAQLLASLVKTYYAKQENLSPEQIFTVSITPCTAEKFERTRPGMVADGLPIVDACITTKETASLLKGATGDMLLSIAPQQYDPPFDDASGAGDIFGVAGGMLEGVMRTFYELFTGKKLSSVDFENVRNSEGFQEINLKVGQQSIHTAIVHGTGNVDQLMKNIASRKKHYHYVEIKGCPQGCARGGGQPLPCRAETIDARSQALYDLDAGKGNRQAHKNPVVKKIYEKFLKKPASSTAKKVLHTKFTQRQRYL